MAVTLVEKYNAEWPKWFEEIKAFLGARSAVSYIILAFVFLGIQYLISPSIAV